MGAAAVVLLGAGGAAAAATVGPTRVAIARYAFDGATGGMLVVTGSFRITPTALFTFADVDVTDPTDPQTLYSQVIDLGDSGGARTYGSLGNRQLCEAPVSCRVNNGVFSFSLTDTVGRGGPAHYRKYLAIRGSSIAIRDRLLDHWTARHRFTGLLTRTDRDAGGAGVDYDGNDVGMTTALTAPGPAGGSIAVLAPNCDLLGAGVLQLTGGAYPATAYCPTEPVSAYISKRTTWRVTGAALGLGPTQTRLVVIAA